MKVGRQEIEEGLGNIKETIEEILSNLSTYEYDNEVPECIKKTTMELLGGIVNQVIPLSNKLYKELEEKKTAEI